MHNRDLNFMLNKNKDLINSENAAEIFQDVLSKTVDLDSKVFYDFLGEILLEKTEHFSGKRYIGFLQSYHKSVLNTNIPIPHLLEMEKYFFEKYCILLSEKVLLSFIGTVRCEGIYFHGRIFITNYRIIVIGNFSFHEDGSQEGSGTSEVERILKRSKRYLNPEILERNLKVTEPKDAFLFGYQFPISYPISIWLIESRGPVCFTSRPQNHSMTYFEFEIYVDKEYEKNWKELLQKIVEILKSLQQDI